MSEEVSLTHEKNGDFLSVPETSTKIVCTAAYEIAADVGRVACLSTRVLSWSDLARRAALVRVVPICRSFINRHLMATRHRAGPRPTECNVALKWHRAHNGEQSGVHFFAKGFVSFRGGQALLFVMHFDPRRFHLGYFSLPGRSARAPILKKVRTRVSLRTERFSWEESEQCMVRNW